LGFIHSAECEILRNNALINIHMIDAVVRVSGQRMPDMTTAESAAGQFDCTHWGPPRSRIFSVLE
jgi:hypothetical protein